MRTSKIVLLVTGVIVLMVAGIWRPVVAPQLSQAADQPGHQIPVHGHLHRICESVHGRAAGRAAEPAAIHRPAGQGGAGAEHLVRAGGQRRLDRGDRAGQDPADSAVCCWTARRRRMSRARTPTPWFPATWWTGPAVTVSGRRPALTPPRPTPCGSTRSARPSRSPTRTPPRPSTAWPCGSGS